MDTSPRFSIATSRPSSRWARTASAAARWAACCTAFSRSMLKYRGTTVFSPRSTAAEAISSASISPLFVLGAAMTGQRSSTRTAFSVISSGSPGPTPTP